MADSFDQFEMLLREMSSQSVIELELESDDVSWQMTGAFEPETIAGRRTSRDGGGATSDFASGYESSWQVRLQRAGIVSSGTFGNTITQGGNDSLLSYGQSADNLTLDPINTPLRSYANVTMQLKKFIGNVAVNREQVIADMAANGIEEVSGGYVEDTTFQVREMYTSLFWSPGDGILARAKTGATVTTSNTTYIDFRVGTAQRFVVGQRYVAGVPGTTTAGAEAIGSGASRAGTTNNPGIFRCVDIDIENDKALFQAEAADVSVSITAGDVIVQAGMYDWSNNSSNAFNGFEKLCSNTGTYPGTAFDRAKHKWLVSILEDYTDSSGDPTESPTPERIALPIDKILSYQKQPPSVLVAEPSVWTMYAQNERAQHSSYEVPQGAAFTASGGVGGPIISHGNQTFVRLSSSKCRPNSVNGLEPSTFKKFIPLGDRTVLWRMQQGGLTGLGGIFRPVISGRQLTDLSVADFDYYIQLGQTDPRVCLRQIGIHSQKTI